MAALSLVNVNDWRSQDYRRDRVRMQEHAGLPCDVSSVGAHVLDNC